jgi:hypothetical protein
MMPVHFTPNPALEKILGLHYRGFEIVSLVFTRPCKPQPLENFHFCRWVEKGGLATIGNPWRFANGAQVLKMVGLDLSASQSGKSQGSPVVSKKGKAEIRFALYQAAMVASSRDKHFVAYFTDQLRGREKEKGIKTKKRVKLAAKMLMIAWTLMKKQQRFDPQYLSTQIEPIAAGKSARSGNRGIPQVQPGADRRL